jgi:hypothetical protein
VEAAVESGDDGATIAKAASDAERWWQDDDGVQDSIDQALFADQGGNYFSGDASQPADSIEVEQQEEEGQVEEEQDQEGQEDNQQQEQEDDEEVDEEQKEQDMRVVEEHLQVEAAATRDGDTVLTTDASGKEAASEETAGEEAAGEEAAGEEAENMALDDDVYAIGGQGEGKLPDGTGEWSFDEALQTDYDEYATAAAADATIDEQSVLSKSPTPASMLVVPTPAVPTSAPTSILDFISDGNAALAIEHPLGEGKEGSKGNTAVEKGEIASLDTMSGTEAGENTREPNPALRSVAAEDIAANTNAHALAVASGALAEAVASTAASGASASDVVDAAKDDEQEAVEAATAAGVDESSLAIVEEAEAGAIETQAMASRNTGGAEKAAAEVTGAVDEAIESEVKDQSPQQDTREDGGKLDKALEKASFARDDDHQWFASAPAATPASAAASSSTGGQHQMDVYDAGRPPMAAAVQETPSESSSEIVSPPTAQGGAVDREGGDEEQRDGLGFTRPVLFCFMGKCLLYFFRGRLDLITPCHLRRAGVAVLVVVAAICYCHSARTAAAPEATQTAQESVNWTSTRTSQTDPVLPTMTNARANSTGMWAAGLSPKGNGGASNSPTKVSVL